MTVLSRRLHVFSRNYSDSMLWLVAVPAAGAALGLLAVLVAERGAGSRPALAALVLVLGAAAGLAPLRYGLPVAIVLASFGGFYLDFVRSHATYWNELFVIGVVARGAITRRPARWELVVAGAIAAFFLAYLASGSKPLAVFWGAKVLLTSVLVGWAVWRLRPGRREWLATYCGLAIAIAAAVVFAAWQRHQGIEGLRALGLELYRIRPTGSGEFRAAGGFTSSAPFSFALAIGIVVWLAWLLGRSSDRRVALFSTWLPVAAAAGLVWGANRSGYFAFAAAGSAAVISAFPIRGAVVIVAAAVAAGTFALASPAVRDAVARPFGSGSASNRSLFWSEYLTELSPLGAGPASAGSAYRRVAPPRRPPRLEFLIGWYGIEFTSEDVPLHFTRARARMRVARGLAVRPRLVFRADVGSFYRPRVLTVHLRRRVIYRMRIPTDPFKPVAISIPPGRGPAVLSFAARPAEDPLALVSPSDRRLVALEFRNIGVSGLPDRPPRTAAEAVYRRVFERSKRKIELGGTAPGLVDNLYLSWLFQYGYVGGAAICGLWIGLLLWVTVSARRRSAATVAAAGVAVFVLVAALAVNVWEETPVDLLTAIIVAEGILAVPLTPRAHADTVRAAAPSRTGREADPER